MDLATAKAAIIGILEAISDGELPEFNHVEIDSEGRPTVWYGGTGQCLGTAKRRSKKGKMQRDPSIYRKDAVESAIHYEMVYRADRQLLDNGDDPAALARLAGER